MRPHATRAPEFPAGSVFSSSGSAWMISEVPPGRKSQFGPSFSVTSESIGSRELSSPAPWSTNCGSKIERWRRAMLDEYAPGEKFLTKGEVAQLCRVEIRTVDRWVAAGKIKCYRIPSGRLLFRQRDVLVAADRR